MAVDLTRFDFHAKRFYFSESVRAMSAEEVGQYMLLLIEAWMGGKDTTLPNNHVYLAQLARVKEVSSLVMSQFHLVETQWGQRYQNETLFEEWMVANQRSDNGRKAVEVRWNNERNTPVSESYIPKPSQAVSNQTSSNQPNDSGNFKNIAVRYRRNFHVNLSHGSLQKEEYAKACREFSEDVVLDRFDEWALDNLWIKERRHTSGLRQFYESLPVMVEADAQIELGQQAEETAKLEHQNIVDASIAAAQEAHRLEEEELQKRRAEEEDQAARVAANPDALFQS